jgi:EmrB/QacA subfamily drug resistance transporter
VDHRWFIFCVVASGVFLASTGITVVNVALPFIASAFQSDVATTQWVLLTYLLTTSSLLINFGRLGDLVGPFRVQKAGFVIFTVSSFLCSLSQSTQMLAALRVFQAMGGAMLVSNGPGIITSAFPPEERGKVLGLQSTVVGTALSIGPTLGGFFIGIFGWRSVFLFNVPIGIVGILLSRSVKPPPPEARKPQIDFVGAALLIVCVVSFALGANRARQSGWSSPDVLFLSGLFLVSLPGFLAAEMLVPQPMLDLRLFRNRVFALAQLGNFLSHMSFFGVLFLMPFYLVQVLKLSAQASGLILLPLTIMMIIMGPVSGFLSDRLGTKWPSVFGAALVCLGLYSLVFLDQESSVLGIVLRLTAIGLGRSVYHSPNSSATMGSVPRERLGMAGGIMATMRHLGNMSGVALYGSYFSARQALHEKHGPIGSGHGFSTSSFLPAFHETLHLSFWIGALALLSALFQKELKLRKKNGDETSR